MFWSKNNSQVKEAFAAAACRSSRFTLDTENVCNAEVVHLGLEAFSPLRGFSCKIVLLLLHCTRLKDFFSHTLQQLVFQEL